MVGVTTVEARSREGVDRCAAWSSVAELFREG